MDNSNKGSFSDIGLSFGTSAMLFAMQEMGLLFIIYFALTLPLEMLYPSITMRTVFAFEIIALYQLGMIIWSICHAIYNIIKVKKNKLLKTGENAIKSENKRPSIGIVFKIYKILCFPLVPFGPIIFSFHQNTEKLIEKSKTEQKAAISLFKTTLITTEIIHGIIGAICIALSLAINSSIIGLVYPIITQQILTVILMVGFFFITLCIGTIILAIITKFKKVHLFNLSSKQKGLRRFSAILFAAHIIAFPMGTFLSVLYFGLAENSERKVK